ncbi:STAS domain-containing protein [Nocardioides sp. MAHUQ-72]|uniref:STAS domain-containing protein n=1 Tax=unclassified Nocardioides TaxID=2615069 RepID=UPI0036123031
MLDRTFEAELVDRTLVVRGDVDDYGIITLRNLLAEHGTTPGTALVVDLSAADYLPSVAVGVLTRALGAAQRAGAEIELVARRGSVAQRVLHVCALPYRESADDDRDPPDADVPA